jgi:hypothetical protein
VNIVIPPPAVAGNSQSAAPPSLQPGEILSALVLQLLDGGKVRIALANTILDVTTQVPLTPGTTVQLAVKGTSPDIVLSLVDPGRGQGGGQASAPPHATASINTRSPATTAVFAQPQGPLVPEPLESPIAENGGTRVASAALAQAVRAAAVRQNGLAPLFADVDEAAAVISLPRPVQQAMAHLLSFRVPTAGPVSAAHLQQAFARSGLFLETHLAAPATATGQADTRPANGAPAVSASAFGLGPNGAVDDLKAALSVLSQVLRAWVGALPETRSNVALPGMDPGAEASNPARNPNGPVNSAANPNAPNGARVVAMGTGAAVADARRLPGLPIVAETGSNEARAAASAARSAVMGGKHGPLASSLPIPSLTDASGDGNLLFSPDKSSVAVTPPEALANELEMAEPKAPRALAPAPPPPYREAPTAAQPAVPASFAPDAEPRVIGERLIAETDAALARQTLLQAASLPDGADRTQRDGAPRWNFEIPLATPHGTAIAQFEIARDGRATQADEIKPVWRARFTLDVEPIGPVHAQIALTGARAAVTLWAERDASAVRLREDAPLLAEALAQAELEPGDVLVRNGEPPRPGVPAGRFLDRAT